MNKYLKLVSNTIVFAIGTFSSKLLVFFLMPLYTRVLTPADYGIMDIIVNTSNLLTPIVIVSIGEGIIRFGLDKSEKKSEVFTTGLAISLGGFLIFALFIPIMGKIPYITGYQMLVYAYVLSACLKTVVSQFVRALGYVKLYAFDGLMNTLMMIILNIMLLVVFKLGVNGYILSVILANLFTTIGMFWIANLKKFVKLNAFSKKLSKAMILYSLPLTPTTIFWWITNVSDRYMVTYFIGESANGIYSVANKIPSLIITLSAIFIQAWQLSAVAEAEEKHRAKFYSNIFKSYQVVVFMAASAILVTIKPFTKIMYAEAYFESWQFVPFLVMSVIFSCFVTFLGTFYMVEKKNGMALVTTCIGAALNIALNLKYIPTKGAMGAAFATFISYFVVFLLRAIDTRRYVKLKFSLLQFTANLAIITAQVGAHLYLQDPVQSNLAQWGLITLMLIVNLKTVLRIIYQALMMLKSKTRNGAIKE